MTKSSLLIGAHLSTGGGLSNALIEGENLGCTAVQIFTHSNRQWGFKELEAETIKAFIRKQNSSPIEKVVVHASYLINPASPDMATRTKSMAMLELELKACRDIRAPYLVLHPGSRLTSDLETAIHHCAQTINAGLKASKETKILIENMAGQGTSIGSRLEELRRIYEKIEEKDRVGFCFDTCHGFAAGYAFSHPQDYEALWKEFDLILGIENLQVLHMNDSQKGLNSHVDRHSNIGEGKIGLEAFELIMNDKRFDSVVKILETPKGLGSESDKKNLNILRSLIKK